MPESSPKPSAGIEAIPSWVYLLALLLGVPLAGGSSALLGAQSSTEDLRRLEEKVDALDDKLDALQLAIVRAHAKDPGFAMPGGTP